MKKDHVMKNVLDVIRAHTIAAIIEEAVTLRRKIGSVRPAETSTFLGELNATVVEKPSMGTSRPTNPLDEITIVQISDVKDLVKKIMVETIGNVLLATTTTSRSERNVIDVESRSLEAEAMIVPGVVVILIAVEDSVEIEVVDETSEEIEVVVVLIDEAEAEMVDETSEEIEVVAILIVEAEAEMVDETSEEIEVVVMSDGIQDEVVQIVIVIMSAPMNAIEKQEGSAQGMLIIEDQNQFVHVAIKAEIKMFEVNT